MYACSVVVAVQVVQSRDHHPVWCTSPTHLPRPAARHTRPRPCDGEVVLVRQGLCLIRAPCKCTHTPARLTLHTQLTEFTVTATARHFVDQTAVTRNTGSWQHSFKINPCFYNTMVAYTVSYQLWPSSVWFYVQKIIIAILSLADLFAFICCAKVELH